MIIKCKNCRGDNQIGAIFCKVCGEKLDMESVDKNIRKHIKTKKTLRLFSSCFRLVLILFFLAAIYGAYLVFEPVKYFRHTTATTLSNDQELSTMLSYDKIDKGTVGTYKFTGEQLTYLAIRCFSKKNNTPTISFPENKYFGFTLTKKLITYSSITLNISVTAVCELVINKDDKGKNILTTNLEYIKLGDLKLPTWYNQLFIEDFKPYISNKKLENFLRKISKVEIADNQISIVLTD